MRHLLRAVWFTLCLTFAALPVVRAEAEGDESNEAKFERLEKEVYQAFKDKKYDDAVAKCKEQSELFPKQPGPYYNLACAQARQEKKADALASLEKSIELGYNDPGHMKQDEDLANLHEEKKFDELATKAGANEKKTGAGYEGGGEIKGLKSIEDMPEGGLRYRLRISEDATKEKPARLVIWLHPSGGSMNSQVEKQLAADFAKHGYALLVMTQKQWAGWTGDEAVKLLGPDMQSLSKVEGLDVRRPLLMGFSAGGQLALQLFESNPDKFGGLILDAAYPIDMALYAQGKIGMMKLPKNEGIKKTPFFVLVGAADPSKAAWEKSEDAWHKAGVPLIVEYVPNGKHQWLVGAAQKKELLAWLDDVAAGKLPGVKDVAEAKPEAKDAPAGEGKKQTADGDKPAEAPKLAPKPPDDGLGGDQKY
ncbi:MAG TPA: hypothetical protein VL860_08165 [Planctomycetota bacterium]|nr:hypothetical protein [Planctomycetota bacterium]